MEFYSRLNDPGVANGETGLWIDGAKKMHKTNINLNATSNRFDQFRLTTNYDVCSGVCHWYHDDVEVWNGCPAGASCSGAPTAPAGLTVL